MLWTALIFENEKISLLEKYKIVLSGRQGVYHFTHCGYIFAYLSCCSILLDLVWDFLLQQAAALASEELVTSLIKIGIISYDDIHLRPPPVTQKPSKIYTYIVTVLDLRSVFVHFTI